MKKLDFCRITGDELSHISYLCLWGISQKQKEAMEGHMKKNLKWIEKMMPHLRITVAFGTRKSRKGLIEYLPIEMAPEPVKGKKSLFINCIWVLPRFAKVGIGTGLMQHMLDDAKEVGGASVIAYEGDKWFEYFDYMPANYFKRFGFREVSRDGTRILLHLDLGAHITPTLLTPKKYGIENNRKTVVDIFCNSQCPWCGWMADEIERNVKGSELTFRRVDTDTRDVIEEYGLARGISINGLPMIRRMASWKEIESTLVRTKSS